MCMDLVRWLVVAAILVPIPRQDAPAVQPEGANAKTTERGRPRGYWTGLYGCWEAQGAGREDSRALVWIGHDPGRGNALYIKVERVGPQGESLGSDYLLDALPTFDGGRLTGRVGALGDMWDLTIAPDGASAQGTWNGKPTAWTRRVPSIRSVELTTPASRLAYWSLRERWNGGKENTLQLRISGEGLPTLWTQVLDVESADAALTKADWKALGDGTVELRLQMASDVRPGHKSLTINGAAAAFDLSIEGFQEPDTPPLVLWLRRAGKEQWIGCDEPMRYGEEWKLRIVYLGEAPTRNIIEVDCTSPGSDAGIVLAYRSGTSRNTFESRAIRVMPTPRREGGR